MIAHAITVRNPFNPAMGREMRALTIPLPLFTLAPTGSYPFIILRNGQAVLRAQWSELILDGDIIHVVVLPMGGGGGSNPMQIVAMLAVMVFAFWAAPLLANAMAFYGASGGMMEAIGCLAITPGLITGGIMIGGSMLVNALLPPPQPSSQQQAAALAAPSPTYSLQAQGNLARLDCAIPVQYGRMMCYPDFAAQPYIEYAGNEQYLYSLLCLGQGEYSLEEVRIEDTPVSSFAEISYELVLPGGTFSDFPANVTTSGEVAGQELLYGAYVGPFVANAAGTAANYIGIDIVMPRGLYHVNETGALENMSLTVQVEVRTIDDNGDPTSSYTVAGIETYTFRTTTPQRASLRYMVNPARYEVRMTRNDAKETESTYGHEVVWAGLRAYLPETRDFGNVTLLAMRMRASNNLSTLASRRVNVICTRKLPIWNGSSWSAATATRSIAWAFADACRNAEYGAGLDDARIDLAALLALDATWISRKDEFNGRFDSAISLWEALTKIAAAGRAKPFMQAGMVRIVRDQQQSIPIALFSMRNILRGSFSVQYLMPTEETADSVEVTFFDANTWSQKRVLCQLYDSTAAKPAKMDLTLGVTSREQAFREGTYQAAANRYRRKLIKFSAEMEGFVPSCGDLIAVSHDMPQWGQVAEVRDHDANNYILTVSEHLTFTPGLAHYIGLRRADGTVSGPWRAKHISAYQISYNGPLDFELYTGLDEERTHLVFGPAETWRQPALVVSVRPRDLYTVEIICINEDVSVHTAESGIIAPPVQYSQLPNIFTSPQIHQLIVRSSPSTNRALLCWTPAPGADTYQIETAAGTDPYAADLAWTRIAETAANNCVVPVLYGAQTLFRVRGVGLTVGGWATIFYGSDSDFMWVDNDALMWDADDQTLMWG